MNGVTILTTLRDDGHERVDFVRVNDGTGYEVRYMVMPDRGSGLTRTIKMEQHEVMELAMALLEEMNVWRVKDSNDLRVV